MQMKWYLNMMLFACLVLATGCSIAPDSAKQPTVGTRTLPTASILLTATPSPTVSVSASPTGTIKPTSTSAPTETASPTLTFTPEPYAGYRIDDLASGSYGDGELVVEGVMAENSYFTRYLISYPSDGLRIYGFMNVPKKGAPPYPVVIALHGYIEPEIYNTLDYTTGYADALAREGYLVLHPNLRGYRPSDSGDNLFRVGMAVDVLNLIALVKEQGGQPGPLAAANPGLIGLWGHSMGGGISTRVVTVSPDVKAVVLYGAMSGDERQNFERIFTYFSNGTRGLEELAVPEDALLTISPIYYLDRIQAAVSIHHGESDVDVPPPWSQDLCNRLIALGKSVECFTYPGQPHTFHGEGNDLFNQRVVDFFNRTLR